MPDETTDKKPTTTQPARAPKTETSAKKRTRKVGALVAFKDDAVNGLQAVKDWPEKITTLEAAKDAYLALKLDGPIYLMRHAEILSAKPKPQQYEWVKE